MKAAQLLDHLVAGAQVEMVGIGQLDLTADVLQIVGGHRPLDGPLGAHIHEHRGLGRTVRAGKHAPAGAALLLDHFKHKKLLYYEINIASPKEKKR